MGQPGIAGRERDALDAAAELGDVALSAISDPADRIIVATARAFDLPLATRDNAIRGSGAARLWTP